MEEYSRVLDYLPQGKTVGNSGEGLIQLIGESYFTLLEATVKQGHTIVPGNRIYVGRETRDIIQKILGRISYEKLTSSAKDSLLDVVKNIVESRESYFVTFINKAGSISMRIHTLDLLPGVGKKTIKTILEERDNKPFADFNDLKERVSGLDPAAVLAHRIVNEIKGEEKYYLFTKPPFKPERNGRFRRRRY